MADNTSNTGDTVEALVLTDQSGNYYAIPREIIERFRVTGEKQVQVEELLGQDVSGYRFAFSSNPSANFSSNQSDANTSGALQSSSLQSNTSGANSDFMASGNTSSSASSSGLLSGAFMSMPSNLVSGSYNL